MATSHMILIVMTRTGPDVTYLSCRQFHRASSAARSTEAGGMMWLK
jgi:hypothetical protein